MNENLIETELSNSYGYIEESISSIENAIELMIYDYDIRNAKGLINSLNCSIPVGLNALKSLYIEYLNY